jgi:hypothetical protein
MTINAPGTEDAAHLSFCLFDRLSNLLIRKGLITKAEIVALLNELVSDLSQDRRAVAQRNVGYVRDTMISKHQGTK